MASQILFTGLLTPFLMRSTQRSLALSPKLQLLAAFRFFATGAYFHVIADTLGLSAMTDNPRCVNDVAVALCSISQNWISYKRNQEDVKNGFFSMAGDYFSQENKLLCDWCMANKALN